LSIAAIKEHLFGEAEKAEKLYRLKDESQRVNFDCSSKDY